MKRLALVLLVGLALAPACKHSDGSDIEKDSPKPPKKKKEPEPEKSLKEPKKHRASHAACSRADTPPSGAVTFGPKLPTPKGPACKSKADCTDKANGRCAVGFCTYDHCYEDKDCGKGSCECVQEGVRGYFCKAGDCAVDADCGAGNYCSPTWGMSCGAFTGVIGYYCHTKKDECTDDDECTENGKGYCAYDNDKGRWRCGYGHCVG